MIDRNIHVFYIHVLVFIMMQFWDEDLIIITDLTNFQYFDWCVRQGQIFQFLINKRINVDVRQIRSGGIDHEHGSIIEEISWIIIIYNNNFSIIAFTLWYNFHIITSPFYRYPLILGKIVFHNNYVKLLPDKGGFAIYLISQGLAD